MTPRTPEPKRAPEMRSQLENKVAILTGGTTGIGRATAKLLAEKGVRLMICGRHEEELKEALADIPGEQGQIFGAVADISRMEDVQELFKETDNRLGKLDILINNAAIGAGSVTDSDLEKIRYTVSSNLVGHMYCCHEAWERMKTNGGGHIVNIGSMSADVRETGSDVYVATKSGIQGFSESFRKMVNPDGIKVSLIEPGSVGTDMAEKTPQEQREEQNQQKMLQAEDIADCVCYVLEQPARCDVVNVQIRPHLQTI